MKIRFVGVHIPLDFSQEECPGGNTIVNVMDSAKGKVLD
jgi:hypothetical protein